MSHYLLPSLPCRLLILPLLAAALIMGCAVHDYKPAPLPIFMPAGSSTAAAPAANEDAPPQPPSVAPAKLPPASADNVQHPKNLSLQDAVAETLSSPAILSAAENVTQASAALWTASTPPNPTFNVSSTLNPLNRSFTPARQGGPPQFDAGISFPIDWLVFGKRSAAIDSAKLGTDAAGADFADLVRQRLAVTAAAFYDVLEAKELLALAQQDAANLRQIAAITDRQVQLGGLSAIEAERIHLTVLDSEREVQRRSVAVQTAKAVLQAALGRSDTAADFDVQGNLDVSAAPKPLSTEDAFRLAEQYRPDIVAKQLKIGKAEADVGLEERKALPQITPAAGYTRQFQEKATGFPDANSWGVGLSVTVPIFDRNQGAIRKADSLLVQARYDLQDRLAALRSEIAQATENFKLARAFVASDALTRVATASK